MISRQWNGGRGGNITMRAALAGAVLILGLAPAFAADDPVLARFVGEWVGRGTHRATAAADTELLYCKVTNKLVDNGTALEQKGRCAIPSSSGAISGKITAQGGGKYDGTLQSVSTEGPATISGTGADSKLTLSAEFTSRLTHKAGKSTIVLTAGNGTYHLVSTQAAAKPFVAEDIVFTHQ